VTGVIVKALSGFYYVKQDDKIIECRASGLFRKKKESLLVGDKAEFDLRPDDEGYITKILPRKNSLIRPPVANIDNLFIISSAVCPKPNLSVIDKLIAICEKNNIEPIIVFNKSDLEDLEDYVKIYKEAGYTSFSISCKDNIGIDKVRDLIKGKISVFCGNSGVGKSSLLNLLDDNLDIKTGEVSEKLGRGRHTTRHTEFYFFGDDTMVADSPGFSSIETEKMAVIKKDELELYFREFEDYLGSCQFTGCSHTKEKGCKIIEAVENGKIAKSRFDSYLSLYEDAKKLKDWEID
jgi:ribosome biogenesis GTPase